MRPSAAPVITIEIATAIGIILFWIGFFTVGLAPTDPPLGYYAFELTFPVPDVLLAATLLTAAFCLRDATGHRGATGRMLSFVAAGALLFLGLLDVSFNLQNRMYTLSAIDGVLAAFVNAWCLIAGLSIILLCRQLP